MDNQKEVMRVAGREADSVDKMVKEFLTSPLEDIHCLRFWEKFALVGAGNPVKNAFVNVAKRFLTAPATSVACERMFSGASNILEEKRARLDPERLNRILFVRQNFVMSNCTLDY